MHPTNEKIIVIVDRGQKDSVSIGNVMFQRALKFSTNYREKSPVLAEVIKGNKKLQKGDIIICHHNRFHENSVYHLGGDIYSIPCNDSIFLRIMPDGNPHSMFDNIICERINKEGPFFIPDPKKKEYHDRVRVISNGYGFKKGDEVFTKPMSDYEIVYHWNNEEKRVIKVKKEDIVAILEKHS